MAIHHEQLSTGALPSARIVEHARGRDRYMRKHHGPLAALAVRVLTRVDLPAAGAGRRSCSPATTRGATARTRPRRSRPRRGEGLAEAAERYNAERAARG